MGEHERHSRAVALMTTGWFDRLATRRAAWRSARRACRWPGRGAGPATPHAAACPCPCRVKPSGSRHRGACLTGAGTVDAVAYGIWPPPRHRSQLEYRRRRSASTPRHALPACSPVPGKHRVRRLEFECAMRPVEVPDPPRWRSRPRRLGCRSSKQSVRRLALRLSANAYRTNEAPRRGLPHRRPPTAGLACQRLRSSSSTFLARKCAHTEE